MVLPRFNIINTIRLYIFNFQSGESINSNGRLECISIKLAADTAGGANFEAATFDY